MSHLSKLKIVPQAAKRQQTKSEHRRGKLRRGKLTRRAHQRRQSARETPNCNQNRKRTHRAALRFAPHASMRAATKLTRALRPFSLNPTGTLLRRHLAHFVAAVDT
jgi:hypothetical protein